MRILFGAIYASLLFLMASSTASAQSGEGAIAALEQCVARMEEAADRLARLKVPRARPADPKSCPPPPPSPWRKRYLSLLEGVLLDGLKFRTCEKVNFALSDDGTLILSGMVLGSRGFLSSFGDRVARVLPEMKVDTEAVRLIEDCRVSIDDFSPPLYVLRDGEGRVMESARDALSEAQVASLPTDGECDHLGKRLQDSEVYQQMIETGIDGAQFWARKKGSEFVAVCRRDDGGHWSFYFFNTEHGSVPVLLYAEE